MPPQDHDPQDALQQDLAALLAASGLSLRDLSRRTDVGHSTISDWKTGKALPEDRDAFIRVVEALVSAGARPIRSNNDWRALLSQARDARPGRRPAATRTNATLAAERRRRTDTATEKALDALFALDALGESPDGNGPQRGKVPGWVGQRNQHVQDLERAVLDIDDDPLKARLEQAILVLKLTDGPEHYAGQSERRTRWLAVEDAKGAISDFRTGRPPREKSPDYRDTIDLVDVYLEELEQNNPGS